MSSTLFNRIYNDLRQKDVNFQEKIDGIGRRGVAPLQKIVAALRMITYGEGADRQDEYIQISEGTARLSNINFCEGIVKLYGKEYLRRPNEEDLTRILTLNAIRGFPGMIGTTIIIMLRCKFCYSNRHYSILLLTCNYRIISRFLLVYNTTCNSGSIDCMHIPWKNCPTAWAGQFTSGKEDGPSVVLEAVADERTWIWHSFFGNQVYGQHSHCIVPLIISNVQRYYVLGSVH